MHKIWWHTLVNIPKFESQNQTLRSASGDNKSVQKATVINNHYNYGKCDNNVFDLQRKAVFNLEISQNGSYTVCHFMWPTGIIKLTSPAASPPSLSSPSSCFSGSTANFFSVKNKLSVCCCFIMKQKPKNKTNKWSVINQQRNMCRRSKCMFQSLLESHGMRDPKSTRT